MDKLKTKDGKGFLNFMRFGYRIYQEILTRILELKKSNYNKRLTAGIKLAIALRYLASGESFHALSLSGVWLLGRTQHHLQYHPSGCDTCRICVGTNSLS
ncbi:hypothetical protein DPMN_042954 [Dreissena polymorpha]|uniref:Uncharacterized protein n=1 Tax=Dreissena polymorpha TaxID=45954 RepID=A0A9D4HZ81_DREPO|nr:hypothetical protein DPMN_042954 [Dreissena polymorpha]